MRQTLCLLALLAGWSSAAWAADVAAGEDMYKRKCMMCHRLSEDMKVGPGLAGVTVRRTEEWLDEWLSNPKAMVEKGDPAAVDLLKTHKKIMATIAAMENKTNRENVIAFLKENDAKLGAVKSEK